LREACGIGVLLFGRGLLLALIGHPVASTAAERLEPWAFAVVMLRQIVVLLWSVHSFRDVAWLSWSSGDTPSA
jgi:hypothetical protein